ncbi:hypothetical protein SAMN04488082_11269 [Desulfomicrobium apsheronum]|uniref:Uncharacterized protein n=1 Tax=Desulfomicrobium apsheronum TaxID=52560 RepID=A0A1I3W7S7_9BACT|nr:hypothetical protein SAMN04488082_11269 [Desulfomicrobium apsheronum]
MDSRLRGNDMVELRVSELRVMSVADFTCLLDWRARTSGMDSRLRGNDIVELRVSELRVMCVADFTCPLNLVGKVVRNGSRGNYFSESGFCFRSGV